MWSNFESGSVSSRESGFILLEVVLALMVFAVAVVGLANALSSTIDTTNFVQRDHTIRLGLEAILNEAKARDDIEEMELERYEPSMGVVFSTDVEEVGDLENREGKRLRDMYLLRATAVFDDGYEEPETVQTYLYKP